MASDKMSHDADYLDFSKLEKEIQNAVVSEERYWRENDAKIRAVEQRAPTYDDFREMVLAAHLKPLEKKDKMNSIEKFTQVWNQSAQKFSKTSPGMKEQMALSKQEKSNSESSKQEKESVTKLPRSGIEFALHWRHHCKAPEEKKQFLFTTGAKSIAELFRVEISGDLLGEFLECLQSIQDSEVEQTVELLEAFTKSQRFSLSLAFLSKKEEESCKLLFEKLKKCLCVQNSALVLEHVGKLENVYYRQK